VKQFHKCRKQGKRFTPEEKFCPRGDPTQLED
jgi:hypothetical protein